jgi:hypothetical protein
VDIRVKTFVAEASSRFGTALEGLGFTGPEVEQGQDAHPLTMSIRYRRGDVTVETFMVLAHGGEEYVCTSLSWVRDAPNSARRVEVATDTAHTGYQMRRALDRHAQAVPDLLRHPDRGH